MATQGLRTIIVLSFVSQTSVTTQPAILMTKSAGTSKQRYTNLQVSQILAIGFLLVILSAAIWQKYQPLLVVATYVLAPLPNWICSHCANPDDFIESSGNAIVDFGRFLTGFLVLMGIGEFVSDCCFPVYRAS